MDFEIYLTTSILYICQYKKRKCHECITIKGDTFQCDYHIILHINSPKLFLSLYQSVVMYLFKTF